jgi:protocatechuate 3,4-dioxygenase beta subunit
MCLLPGWFATVLAIWLGPAVMLTGDPPAAGGDLGLEVRVVGIDGKPVERSTITLWRLVPEAERRREEAGELGQYLWREAAAGRVWVPMGTMATGDRWRRDGLAPGTYRATGHLGPGAPTPVGVSEVVTLDGARKTTTLTFRLKPGARVSIRLVDSESQQPVRGARVSLVREDLALPPSWDWTPTASDDRDEITIPHLPPGTYTLDASRQAPRPEEREYSIAEKGKKLVVVEGVDQVVQVAMAGRALTQPEIEQRWGWVATGTVLDESGRPVADAEVRVATGMGTLMGGGSTRTGPDGRFTLRFAEGWMSPDPANVQAAVFSVAKEGFIEKSRSRPGNHLMARQMPQDLSPFGGEPDKVILKGRPYGIDFIMTEPATVEIHLDGPANSPPAVVGQDERDGRFSVRQGAPNRWDVLPGRPWWFELGVHKTRSTVRSFPITLPRAGRYRLVLRYTPDPQTGVDLLEILSVIGPVGNREIRDKVVGDDPMARPPVAEALQRRGHELLRRMAEANRPWLGPVPEAVKTYEYRFRFGEQEGQTFRVGEKPVPGTVRRGISHASAVHYLARNPEVATFRQVEVGDDRIILAYTLKEPIGVSAGNGVQTTWHGFFSMPFREGMLVLDARRLTPLESRSKALHEAFSQYVEVEPGRFAPLAIRIRQGGGEEEEVGMQFDWTFQVVEPRLWLFAASEGADGRIIARADRLRVNGAEAKLVARGEVRAAGPD